MYLQHEESINRDISRIRDHILEMAGWAEKSLRDSIRACVEQNHQLAYAIILRDQYIDEKEKEIDRLCLEFIIKQQPVAQPLRFAFSAIKLNMEIERIGDYAESIARHIFRLKEWPEEYCKSAILQLADISISMFSQAIQSFTEQSVEKARSTLMTEETVDKMRNDLFNNLLSRNCNSETLIPLLNIIRRFERVADQARNICMEALYMCTGEYAKHIGAETIRVLFVDEHNSMRSRIAEAIANGMNLSKFVFSSAGLDPRPIDPKTVAFMKSKGYDLTNTTSRSLDQIPNLDYYQVVIVFAPEAKSIFPKELRKTIYLDWEISAPSLARDDEETINAGYENMFNFIFKHVTDLVNAIMGVTADRKGGSGDK